MKLIAVAFLYLFSTSNLIGQNVISSKEIIVDYSNGKEIFRICASGCKTNFDDKKIYHWYTDFSKIKSTKGGSAGNLLHGSYKFFDENGNLRVEKNYFLGLLNGTHKAWDSTGNLNMHIKYEMGSQKYFKIYHPEGDWIEWIGTMMAEGSKKRIYNKFNKLLVEEIVLPQFRFHRKVFFESSGTLSQEYTLSSLGSEEYLRGKFVSYHENGHLKVEGQLYEGDYTNIRVGTWKYYNEDGTLRSMEKFQSGAEFWNNGKYKIKGGYIFDDEDGKWKKNGDWIWYGEDGTIESEKKFEWDIEVE